VALKSIQLWITMAVLVLAPLFFGSVDLFWNVFWVLLLSIGLLAGSSTRLNSFQWQIFAGFLALCAIYGLAALVQVTPGAFGKSGDPIWARVNANLGLDVSPRISARAEIPPIAIGHLLLLAVSFSNGFLIGASSSGAKRLTRFAAYAILAFAVYGIGALILTPNRVLWAPKTAYLGNLTGSFINHNTAATFLGAGAIMWFCSALSLLQSFRVSSFRHLLLAMADEESAMNVVGRSAAAFTCFLAVLLTESRGGLIACCLGLLVALALVIASRKKRLRWYVWVGSAVFILGAVNLLSRIGRIGSQGLFDNGRWSIYEYCLEAIRRRPFLGSGAGTFPDIFPSLRDASLFSGGVWEYAHSTILEIAVEMGAPIAILVLMACVASLSILARAAIRANDRESWMIAAIAGVVALGYGHSLIDFSLQIPGVLVTFSVLLGCGLARASAQDRSGRAEAPPRGALSGTARESGEPLSSLAAKDEGVSHAPA
jgi:O-antigen ligase